MTLHDIWFYAFLITTLILGWVYGRFRTLVGPLYDSLKQLELERDAQARTIQGQRKVITQLENEKYLQKAQVEAILKEAREQ